MLDLLSKQYMGTTYYTSGAAAVAPLINTISVPAGQIGVLSFGFSGSINTLTGNNMVLQDSTASKIIYNTPMQFNPAGGAAYVSYCIQNEYLVNGGTSAVTYSINCGFNFPAATGIITAKLMLFKI